MPTLKSLETLSPGDARMHSEIHEQRTCLSISSGPLISSNFLNQWRIHSLPVERAYFFGPKASVRKCLVGFSGAVDSTAE